MAGSSTVTKKLIQIRHWFKLGTYKSTRIAILSLVFHLSHRCTKDWSMYVISLVLISEDENWTIQYHDSIVQLLADLFLEVAKTITKNSG